MNWVPYDPTWLVEAVLRQRPDDLPLRAALAECTSGSWESTAYIYFIDPSDAGSDVDHVVALENTPFGSAVVDILEDGRVRGVWFVDNGKGRSSTKWAPGVRRWTILLLVAVALVASAAFAISMSNEKVYSLAMLGSLFRTPSRGVDASCGTGRSMADKVYLKAKPHVGDDVVSCTECAGPDVTTRIYEGCQSLGLQDCKWSQMEPWARGQGRMGVRFPDGSALWLYGKVDWDWESMDVEAVTVEAPRS